MSTPCRGGHRRATPGRAKSGIKRAPAAGTFPVPHPVEREITDHEGKTDAAPRRRVDRDSLRAAGTGVPLPASAALSLSGGGTGSDSTASAVLASSVCGSAAGGYYKVSADGGVFTSGAVRVYGSIRPKWATPSGTSLIGSQASATSQWQFASFGTNGNSSTLGYGVVCAQVG